MAKIFNTTRIMVSGAPKIPRTYQDYMSEYAEEVATVLKICHRDAMTIIESTSKERMPVVTLIEQCKVIKALDVPPFSIPSLLHCVKLHPHDLQHRYYLLQELGVKNITLHNIGILKSLMRLPVSHFKAYFLLPPNESLVKNIFNSIEEYPKNMPSLEKYQNSMCVEDLYTHYLVCYKRWKVGMFWKKWNQYYSRSRKTLQLLSFRMIKETEHMLRTEFGVQGPITKQLYPFFISTPTNIKVLLSNLREFDLGGKNITDVIKQNPRILLSDPHNVYSVCKVLKEHNVPVEAALDRYRNAEIFILDSLLITERLNEFSEDPFIQLWIQHRSVVNMILHHKTVWRNVYILRATNCIGNSSFATLTLSFNHLYSFFKRNCPVYPGKYVKYLLDQQLGFEADNKTLHYLQRHARWFLLTALHISEMLQFLKTLFPNDAIRDNIHVIMYSRSDVSDALDQVKKCFNIGYYSYSHQLALCVYLLEKKKRPIMDSQPRLVQSTEHNTIVKSKACLNRQMETILDTIVFSDNLQAQRQ